MDDNIVQFGQVKSGKSDEKFPSHPYAIIDIDGDEHYAEGYLIFTSHHVCVMEDSDNGPVTAIMVPLERTKLVSLLAEDDED